MSELTIKSTQVTMHTSINHEERIEKNNDLLTGNGDLNLALPTNILNTSSILKWVSVWWFASFFLLCFHLHYFFVQFPEFLTAVKFMRIDRMLAAMSWIHMESLDSRALRPLVFNRIQICKQKPFKFHIHQLFWLFLCYSFSTSLALYIIFANEFFHTFRFLVWIA